MIKKILSLSCLQLLFITGCSAPAPVKYPDSAKIEDASQGFTHSRIATLQKNRYDPAQWDMRMNLIGADIDRAENVSQIWYLAQHADQIDISGEARAIQRIKEKFIAHGAAININLYAMCVNHMGSYGACPDLVSIHFIKGNTAEPEAPVKETTRSTRLQHQATDYFHEKD